MDKTPQLFHSTDTRSLKEIAFENVLFNVFPYLIKRKPILNIHEMKQNRNKKGA